MLSGWVEIVGTRVAVGEEHDHVRRARPSVGCQGSLGRGDRIGVEGAEPAWRCESVRAFHEVGVRIEVIRRVGRWDIA
jgi:hypothetical protein